VKIKKLKKRCTALSYQVTALELEQRITDLKAKAGQTKPVFGFHQVKAKESAE